MYSELHFTFEKDKLIALSGIVERMAKLWPDNRYIAGLWEENLLLQLSWFADFDEVARPSSFRAPTWSWASIKSVVSWSSVDYSAMKGVEVVDVSCPAVYTGTVCCEDDENPGLGPTITIRGPMMAARLSPRTVDRLRDRHPTGDHEREYYGGVKLAGEHAAAFEGIKMFSFYPDYLFHNPGRYYVAPDSELFLLPLLLASAVLDSILLKKREGTLFYERVGLVKISMFYNQAAKLQSLLNHVYSLALSDITIM